MLSDWYKTCLDLLFPAVCVICMTSVDGASPLHLCSKCLASVNYIQSPLCNCCGKAFTADTGEDRLCSDCLIRKPLYTGARSLVYYTPPVSTLIHKLKYNGTHYSLQILSELSKRFDFAFFEDCEIIIPVPLHRRRLQKRGFNQSLLFARMFFPDTAADIVPGVLVRVRDTIPQTSLVRADRLKNLKHAFAIKNQADVRERRICLVDDVLTTGTTINECCKALIQAGSKEIKVLTMARVAVSFFEK